MNDSLTLDNDRFKKHPHHDITPHCAFCDQYVDFTQPELDVWCYFIQRGKFYFTHGACYKQNTMPEAGTIIREWLDHADIGPLLQNMAVIQPRPPLNTIEFTKWTPEPEKQLSTEPSMTMDEILNAIDEVNSQIAIAKLDYTLADEERQKRLNEYVNKKNDLVMKLKPFVKEG